MNAQPSTTRSFFAVFRAGVTRDSRARGNSTRGMTSFNHVSPPHLPSPHHPSTSPGLVSCVITALSLSLTFVSRSLRVYVR